MNKEIIKRVGFDQKLEANFLVSLDDFEVRKQVLEDEVSTAIHEAFLHKFENGYWMMDGKIVDKTTQKPLEDLVISCGRLPEIEALRKIQEKLSEEVELVVHFSPKNEEYDYPMDCVDFWWKKDEEVRWMRVVVNNDFENMQNIYKNIGGSETKTVMEMLAEPLAVNNLKISEVLLMLDTMEEINKISSHEIRESVKLLMAGFLEEFDEEIVKNPDVIFRLFSAAMAEAKRINNQKRVGNRYDLEEIDMWMYLNAQMEMKTVSTFGCASFNNVGEFGSGQGYFIIKNSDGSIKVSKGKVPEGFKYCEHCGMYYDGDKCPVCN